jgi:hypothetical protein
MRRFAVVCALLFGALPLSAANASDKGYCIATTDEPADCYAPCVTTGLPLYWGDTDITYTLNHRGFPEVEHDAALAIFDCAFAAWEAVKCDGESLGFNFEATGEDSDLGVGPLEDEPNDNVLWLPSEQEWDELEYDEWTYAMTVTWYDIKGSSIGRIRSADVSFNPRRGPWTLCKEERCPVGNDLLAVATHEAGHVLGLAHSSTNGSTMFCSANEGETELRTLEDEDREGLCAIYGAKGVRPIADRDSDSGCSVRGASRKRASLAAWSTGLLALALAGRLRRRVR